MNYTSEELAGIFTKFDFTAADCKLLKSVAPVKEKDQRHMTIIVSVMYRNETEKLQYRSVRSVSAGTYTRHGKPFTRPSKTAATPEKADAMKILHDDRIRNCDADDVEKADRLQNAYVNGLIGSSIRSEYNRNIFK